MTNEEAKQWILDHMTPDDDTKQSQVMRVVIKALEQNVKLKETIEKMDKWVHSGNRGNCDYFIVDQVENIINGLKKDGMVSK